MMEPYVNIHHFDGNHFIDEDGEPMLGWYYELMAGDDTPLCGLMGPYMYAEDAEAAADRAAERGEV